MIRNVSFWLAPLSCLLFLFTACCKEDEPPPQQPNNTTVSVKEADQKLDQALAKCKESAMSPGLMMALAQSKDKQSGGSKGGSGDSAILPLLMSGLNQKDSNGKDCSDGIMNAAMLLSTARNSEGQSPMNDPQFRDDYLVKKIAYFLTKSSAEMNLNQQQQIEALGGVNDWYNKSIAPRLGPYGAGETRVLNGTPATFGSGLPTATNTPSSWEAQPLRLPAAKAFARRETVIEQKMQARLIERDSPVKDTSTNEMARKTKEEESLGKLRSIGALLGISRD